MTDFRLSKATKERSLRIAKGEPASPPLQLHPFVERILNGDSFTREEIRENSRLQRQKAAMVIARCIELHGEDKANCPHKNCPHTKVQVHKLLAYAEESFI